MVRKLGIGAVAIAAFAIGLSVSLGVSRQPTPEAGERGTGPAPLSGPVARSNLFWSAMTVNGMSAESYDSLETLAESADLVVVATVETVERGREWVAIPEYVDDPVLSDGAIARFATVTLSIEQIVGPVRTPLADRSSVRLEAFLARADTLEIIQDNLPRERAIFFLRNKGQKDSVDFYRFTNDGQGLLRDFDGRVQIAPTGEDHFLTHLDGERFEDVLAKVIQARGGS